jgi:hypothetical protein
MHIQIIFADGSSMVRTSRYHRTEHEALMDAWYQARLTGKEVKSVGIL